MTDDAPVYVLVTGDGFEQAELSEYVAALPAAWAPFQGEFELVSANTVLDVKEGSAPKLLFLARWSSKRAFDAYWASDAYQRAKAMREGVGRFNVLVLPAA